MASNLTHTTANTPIKSKENAVDEELVKLAADCVIKE